MDYHAIYDLLEDTTPLHFDCGLICAGACCAGDDERGMLLFPGEEAMFKGVEGYTIKAVKREDMGAVHLLVCPGVCSRETRPLACRVFPLTVSLSPQSDRPQCVLDARAKWLCPLYAEGIKALSPEFVQGVQRVFDALYAKPELRAFLAALSAEAQGPV